MSMPMQHILRNRHFISKRYSIGNLTFGCYTCHRGIQGRISPFHIAGATAVAAANTPYSTITNSCSAAAATSTSRRQTRVNRESLSLLKNPRVGLTTGVVTLGRSGLHTTEVAGANRAKKAHAKTSNSKNNRNNNKNTKSGANGISSRFVLTPVFRGNSFVGDSMNMDDDIQDRFEDRGGAGRNRRAGGGRRGRGGGGGGGGNRQVMISKALSTLLRHQAQNAGIELDAEGFAPLDRVLQWPRLRALNPSVAEIQEEVSTNAKQRFSIKPNPNPQTGVDEGDASYWLIRANQGHSIALASEGLHTPITLAAANVPPVVVHGTYFAFWPAIVAAGGLKKMGRTHVHFGTGVPGGDAKASASSSSSSGGGGAAQVHTAEDEVGAAPKVISGMRADAEVLIFVDVERALRDADAEAANNTTGDANAMKWWLSENNVVLTEGDAEGVVPLKYFKEVRGRRQGVGVLWKDGEKVADLPDHVVARIPQGKGRGGGGGGGRRGGRGGRGG
ncbi:KptA family-domain-containing protein [Nemania sp. FL0916]|nr:KptA family-domain-containing protein [Nemania sp. FL0916]